MIDNTNRYQVQRQPKKKFKMIAIDESNYEALRDLGRTPNSFNDVVTKLLATVRDGDKK